MNKLTASQLMKGADASVVTVPRTFNGKFSAGAGQVVTFPPNKTNLLLTVKPKSGKFAANLQALAFASPKNIPDEFDWRKYVELSPVQNQGMCGSCYAMASAACLSDRIRVYAYANKLGNIDLVLSALDLLSCTEGSNQLCNGGLPEVCGQHMQSSGIPLNSCASWEKWCQDPSNANCCMPGGANPSCAGLQAEGLNKFVPRCDTFDKCDGIFNAKTKGTEAISVMAQGGTYDIEATLEAIKLEVMNNGPVVAKYAVFSDFQEGSSGSVVSGDGGKSLWLETDGIYVYDGQSPFRGGHAVCIVGFGKGNAGKYGEVPYWIVKNSWSDGWGEKGYFKIAMTNPKKGINESVGFDIPTLLQGQSFGGVVAFDLGNNISVDSLRKYAKEGNREEPNSEPDSQGGVTPKKEGKKFFPLIIGGFILFLIYWFYNHSKKTEINTTFLQVN